MIRGNGQVTQRQTKFDDSRSSSTKIWPFSGSKDVISCFRLWIELLVQQVYDRWCHSAGDPATMVPTACHGPQSPQGDSRYRPFSNALRIRFNWRSISPSVTRSSSESGPYLWPTKSAPL